MATKAKKKTVRKPSRSTTARAKLSTARSKPRKHAPARAHRRKAVRAVHSARSSGLFWKRPEVLALTGVAVTCVVAAGIFLAQRNGDTSPTRVTERVDAKAPNQSITAKTVSTEAPKSAPTLVLTREFAKANQMPMADRIAFWGTYVMKVGSGKGELAALGVGHKIEDDAPVVPSTFNCTTFVETVSSLARSSNSGEFFEKLMAMRYKNARATFADRNHFPEVDWIPNNARAGILNDVTAKVAEAAGVKTLTEKKEINRVSWLAKELEKGRVARQLASVAQKKWANGEPAEVRYIPMKSVPKILSKIENGTIINFVHKDSEKKPVLISHQGLLIREGGTVYLKHAASDGKVRRQLLTDYISALARQPAAKDWPMAGINLNQLN